MCDEPSDKLQTCRATWRPNVSALEILCSSRRYPSALEQRMRLRSGSGSGTGRHTVVFELHRLGSMHEVGSVRFPTNR